MKRRNIFIGQLGLYIIFWFVLAEKIDFQIILAGIVVTISMTFYSNKRRDTCNTGKRFHKLELLKVCFDYLVLLINEIVVASIHVAKIVLSRRLNIDPSIIRFKTRLKNDLLKTILANSITLTPGTITIEIVGDEFIVHCISKNQIKDVVNSGYEELLLKLEE